MAGYVFIAGFVGVTGIGAVLFQLRSRGGHSELAAQQKEAFAAALHNNFVGVSLQDIMTDVSAINELTLINGEVVLSLVN